MQNEYEIVIEDSEEVKAPTPNPDEQPKEEPKADPIPAEVKPTESPAEQPKVEEELFETPDGRKVNKEEFQKLWKEHFYPDYTRKSQRLAELEKGGGKEINNPPEKKIDAPWKDPSYVPETYAEIVEYAKAEAIKEFQETAKRQVEEKAKIESIVENEIAELKKLDPNLDQNSLFLHANKYGFTDLRKAYENMSEFNRMKLDVEQNVIKNLKKREEVPVNAKPTPPAPSDNPDVIEAPTKRFSSAQEHLAYLKGNR